MRTSAERRARRRNLFIEKVDRQVLWERHNGICGICRTPVKFAAMTIDHRIPLAKGGLHSYANCQPSHEECNLAKGSMVEYQHASRPSARQAYLNHPHLAKAS